VLASAAALAAFAPWGASDAGAGVIDGRPDGDYWLLTEFDWGDDPEVVLDSLEIAPGFVCYDSGAEPCKFVRVAVDGEELLARFDYREDRLWQVRFVTPELTRRQADEHLLRVVGRLAGYEVGRSGGKFYAGAYFYDPDAPPESESLSPPARR
jgi:hypothetical protein